MRRLLIGDKKVRVRDEGGTADRPAGAHKEPAGRGKAPVVLIHGAGASSVAWMDVVKRLAPSRRAIAPDLPGHGQSDPWHEVSIDGYRDAVGTICAQLSLEKVVLVGHSMGGAIALRCALAWPERVAALVLVCSGARMKTAPATLAAFSDEEIDPDEVIERMVYSPSTPRSVIDRWRAVNIQAPREIVVADFRACDGFDVRPSLRSIRMPALCIGGSDDLAMPPKFTLEAAAGMVNARAVILPHTGHMTFHEQPDAFHAALDAFLAEVP